MKKILPILSILPFFAMAESVPSDGIVSTDFTQTGEQTITSQLNVASATTLKIQGSLTIDNDTNPLNNLGTIQVAEGATLTIDSIENTTVSANQPWSSHIGNLIISGKVYSSIGNSHGLHLYGGTDTARPNIVLNETGLIHLTNGRMGFNNYYSQLTLNATTSKDNEGNWQTGLITNMIQQSRGANASKYSVVVNANDAFCKDDGSATDIMSWSRGSLVLDYSGANGNTDIGTIHFRNLSIFKFILSETEDVMTIDGLTRYTASDGAVTADMVFENFANGLIKIENFDSTRLTDTGIYTFNAGEDIITITISATNGDISSADGNWYYENGFLNNTAFAVVVPEPAEWAILLSAIALGFAIYRRRK